METWIQVGSNWLFDLKHDLKDKEKIFSMSQSIFQHIYIRDASPEDLHSQGPPSSPVDTKHPLCRTPEHRLIKLSLYDLFLAEVINKRIPAGHSTPEHRGHRFPHTWHWEQIICCHWIIWRKKYFCLLGELFHRLVELIQNLVDSHRVPDGVCSSAFQRQLNFWIKNKWKPHL